MKVMLTEANMTEAMELYIHDKITVPDDAKLIVEFVAGRGDNGFSATVGIYGPGEEPAVAGTKKTATKAHKAPATPADPNAPAKRRGRPPKAVAQALPADAAPVETPVDETASAPTETAQEEVAVPIEEVADTPVEAPVAEAAVAATPATQAAPVAAPVQPTAEAAVAENTDVAPRTSLFGNLKKPVNTPAAA